MRWWRRSRPPPRKGCEAPLNEAELQHHLELSLGETRSPFAIRIDGDFDAVRIRSVPRQERPYPKLAESIAHQHVRELRDVSGTMVGFCFPHSLDGIEMVGWHLHFATDEETCGGHVLSYMLREARACFDQATELHVELPPRVEAHHVSTLVQGGSAPTRDRSLRRGSTWPVLD